MQQATCARKGVFAGVVAAALAASLMIPSLAYADPSASEKQAEAQAALASLNSMQSTLDQAAIVYDEPLAAQQAAEAAIAAKEQRLGGTIHGALVAIDPNTGHVKALGGGRGDSELNLATGKGTNPTNPGRPCGSTFKTFTLIAALEAGINPKTMVDCTSPAVIPDAGYPASNPLNNINNQSFGNISMQKAFAKSSNTGFVRLEMAVGIDKVINTAKNMGITSPLNPVGSLTLGQQNVTVLDLAKSYAPIANGGTKYDAQPILRISDKNGNIIADNSAPGGERAMSPEVAKATTDVMKTAEIGRAWWRDRG